MTALRLPMTRRQIARNIARRADEMRDARRAAEAATLYAQALHFVPGHAGYHVQCANMLKDSGRLDEAEAHYVEAETLRPNDADIAMQQGHLYKISGHPEKAEAAYSRALALKPGFADASNEIANLRKDNPWIAAEAASARQARDEVTRAETLLRAAGSSPIPIADLAPPPHESIAIGHNEDFELRHIGRPERSWWGVSTVLRGVESVRGFCISAVPIVEVQMLLNGRGLSREPVAGGFPLVHENRRPELRKYPFNVWLDFSDFPKGRSTIEVRVVDARGQVRRLHREVVIEHATDEASLPRSDGLLTLDPTDDRSVDKQINSRPSMVRPGRRRLFDVPPRTILVQRVDQLGDMVVSVPALRRLRELLPEARIVGLLSRANVDLATSLDLFDEILATDFPEDPFTRRRSMSIDEQRRVADMLRPYSFEMAIDMSENPWSRPLLLLSGAPILYGFVAGPGMPGLSIDIAGNTHDRIDNMEVVPHSNKLLGMIEWLAAMMRDEPNIVPRTAPADEALAALGLVAGGYLVLHDGARLPFSRWPGYLELATKLLDRTTLKLVMLSDDPSLASSLPAPLLGSDRFQLIDRRLTFDSFDALVSRCAAFVGNDSGPKHLAALRGAKVVSIHMARNNWNEWGQETGLIVSRRVPCAGCVIHHDPEECGKDFVCMSEIRVEEVLDAVTQLLAGTPASTMHLDAASSP